jgi:hypothetical protein
MRPASAFQATSSTSAPLAVMASWAALRSWSSSHSDEATPTTGPPPAPDRSIS